ncbi:hypothetical protein EVAR_52675_1 [Eumeta japonica]|uniref:Uncharacterized protein n=1 Tax=Eumeta variegata TaxID=151549 RepID=A0A4C1ZKF5_EUMVA|nr:hypothetical protein EVAR_52675_1 [Eumeta japonica]
MDINIEKRGRRKVKRTMPGESAHDAGLSIQEEMRRSMYECIDRFLQELSTRYGAMKQINNIFQIIETKFMLEASDDALAVTVHNLIQIYGEFEKEQVPQKASQDAVHVHGCSSMSTHRIPLQETELNTQEFAVQKPSTSREVLAAVDKTATTSSDFCVSRKTYKVSVAQQNSYLLQARRKELYGHTIAF